MATGDQIKALLTSHLEGDEERFFSAALQVAAHEARAGHGKLAEELRALVDKAKNGRDARSLAARPAAPSGGGIPAGLLEASYRSAVWETWSWVTAWAGNSRAWSANSVTPPASSNKVFRREASCCWWDRPAPARP